MKIKDLEIGKVYYVSYGLLTIETSPKLLLLDKEDTQYLFKVWSIGMGTKRCNGEVFWKKLNELSKFEDCFFEDCIQYITSGSA